MASEIEVQQYFELAKSCALEAGAIIRDAWKKPTIVEYKAATDLVTETDKRIEETVIHNIRRRYPSHCFVAEEDISQGKSKEELSDAPTWIIDPLDGTINFVHRIPMVAVSIGFAVNKKVLLGIIYNPIQEEMFTAIRGKGAFLNGNPIQASNRENLKSALIATGCGAELPEEEEKVFLQRMKGIIDNCRSWRRQGSAALDMAFVASGRIDVYCEQGVHAWDIAAGVVIVEEAGGVAVDISGGTLDLCRRKILAGNKFVVPKFVEMLSQ